MYSQRAEKAVQNCQKGSRGCEKPSDFAPIYSDDLTIKEKVDKIAKTIYGASRVNYTKAAEKGIKADSGSRR